MALKIKIIVAQFISPRGEYSVGGWGVIILFLKKRNEKDDHTHCHFVTPPSREEDFLPLLFKEGIEG